MPKIAQVRNTHFEESMLQQHTAFWILNRQWLRMNNQTRGLNARSRHYKQGQAPECQNQWDTKWF